MPLNIIGFYLPTTPPEVQSRGSHLRRRSSTVQMSFKTLVADTRLASFTDKLIQQAYYFFMGSSIPNDQRLNRWTYHEIVKLAVSLRIQNSVGSTRNAYRYVENQALRACREKLVSHNELVGAHGFNFAKNTMMFNWLLLVLYHTHVISKLRVMTKIELSLRELAHTYNCCGVFWWGTLKILRLLLLAAMELPRLLIFAFCCTLYFPMAAIGDFITHPAYMMSRRNPLLGYSLIGSTHLATIVLSFTYRNFFIANWYHTILSAITTGENLSNTFVRWGVESMTKWLGHYFAASVVNSVLLLSVGVGLGLWNTVVHDVSLFPRLLQTYRKLFFKDNSDLKSSDLCHSKSFRNSCIGLVNDSPWLAPSEIKDEGGEGARRHEEVDLEMSTGGANGPARAAIVVGPDFEGAVSDRVTRAEHSTPEGEVADSHLDDESKEGDLYQTPVTRRRRAHGNADSAPAERHISRAGGPPFYWSQPRSGRREPIAEPRGRVPRSPLPSMRPDHRNHG